MISPLENDAIEVAEHVRRLRPYSPGRPIEEVQRELGITDIIKLASNENPLGPSPAAIRAMQEAAPGIGLYPEDSCHELRRALASHLEVAPEMLIFGNGSDEIIHCLGLAFLMPGDEVIQAQPSFSRYEAAATLNQAGTVTVPLRNHTHDLDAIADTFTRATRLVFVCNPNNPTGTMITRADVERLLDRLPSRAIAVFDEAYCEYVENPDYPDSLDYVRQGANVVVLRTFSKVYALAGLRVGYGIARPEIIRYLNQVRDPFNVNTLAQVAATASLGDPGQVTRSRELNHRAKALLAEAFESMGLSYIPSVANFIMVDTGRPAREVCPALERRGVIVRSGEPFGMPTYIRVTTGTLPECERFVRALQEVLAA